MSLSTLAMLGRALLLLVSFTGLCATVRTSLKINRFIAPFITVSGIIVALMLGGMLRVLEPVFWGIYALGFLGLIYTYFIRKVKPEYGLIATLLVFSALLAWRYYPCVLYVNDDVSHWALVARHLLRYNSFPDANAPYVFFQSYPLGAASFIYYICKTVGNTEGLYLIAQNFMLGPLFLPMLANISSHRKYCYPIATACFLFFFHYFRVMGNLHVDLLLAFFGIGAAASAAFYRNDLRKALIAAIPGMLAVVYIKNSGMFFAMATALGLIWIAKRRGCRRATIWKVAIFSIAGFIAAYLLWIIHIRLSYPAALDTKHAVSLSAYMNEISNKGASTAIRILKMMAAQLFGFSKEQIMALVFMLGSAVLLVCGCLMLPGQRRLLPKLMKSIVLCSIVYGVWYIMLTGMYLFSMPEDEALSAASFYRYNGTGLTYMMGLTAIILFSFWSRDGLPLPKLFKATGSCACIFIIGFLALYCVPDVPFMDRALYRATEHIPLRQGLIAARQEYKLDDDDHFLIYCTLNDETVSSYYQYYYTVKYEFETTNIHMIAEEDGRFLAGTHTDKTFYTELQPYFAETMDQCDAMLVLAESPAFESQLNDFLETYTGDTPVIYIYKY